MKKDAVIKMLDSMDDEFMVEELVQRLVFIADVDKGMQNVKRGETRDYEVTKRKFLDSAQ